MILGIAYSDSIAFAFISCTIKCIILRLPDLSHFEYVCHPLLASLAVTGNSHFRTPELNEGKIRRQRRRRGRRNSEQMTYDNTSRNFVAVIQRLSLPLGIGTKFEMSHPHMKLSYQWLASTCRSADIHQAETHYYHICDPPLKQKLYQSLEGL